VRDCITASTGVPYSSAILGNRVEFEARAVAKPVGGSSPPGPAQHIAMIRQVWHWISGLPLALHLTALFAVALATAKRKAISAAIKKAKESVEKWFWGWVRGKVASPNRPNYDKTYKGAFQIYSRYANYPHEWFFEILQDGTLTKVPVMATNLLTGVQHGTFVEIDTQVLPGAKVEVVRRVQEQHKQ
jgi:hypothetical protein